MQVKYRTVDNRQNNEFLATITNQPDYCPVCNLVQEPKFMSAFQINEYDQSIELVYKCTNKRCMRLFICSAFRNGGRNFDIRSIHPKFPIKISFNEIIENLSPLFVEIYNQAKAAEDIDLNHVAGMGYRKSLEFLIKDYLINFKMEDEETIKKTFLGNCIKNYLSDNIKKVAELATWLGNDETHYHRIWENKDINDLKTLIELTRFWITSEIQTAKYIEEMAR